MQSILREFRRATIVRTIGFALILRKFLMKRNGNFAIFFWFCGEGGGGNDER